MVDRAQTNGLNGALGPHADDERPPEPPPDAVAELAASCARFVHAKYKVPMDGTTDTLSLLDQYVRDAREAILVKPDTVDLLQATIGAYLGEVIRRAHGGEWFSDGDYDGWRLMSHDVYLTFNPIGMAREALLLREAEGWHAHLEVDPGDREEIERRVLALPEVSDDEYYAPSTRFDVVSLVFEALRAKMVASGLGDVRFTREDYR